MEVLSIIKSNCIYLVDYATDTDNRFARISEAQLNNFIESQGYNEGIDNNDNGNYYIMANETAIENHGLYNLIERYIKYKQRCGIFDTFINDKNNNRIFVEVLYKLTGFRLINIVLSDEDQNLISLSSFAPAQQFEIYAQIFEHKAQSLSNNQNTNHV